MKPVKIAGAGLAGLTLGNALQKAGVPTAIHEASVLPRHRVCGEFICGQGASRLRKLGFGSTLEGALPHQSVNWYLRETKILESRLPTPALGISRYELDKRLAKLFRDNGGQLHERSRLRESSNTDGTVLCSGRRASNSDWIGLKLHCTDLKTTADLELHLGPDAYLGMSAIENGRVNVCALFKQRPELKANRADWIHAYLSVCGLNTLSERIQAGGIDPHSHAGVAGIQFAQSTRSNSTDTLRLGDAYSVIPPFTGNGMSIAIESAEIAFPEVLAYASEQQDWHTTIKKINRRCHSCFSRRLWFAQKLHPWINESKKQQALALLSKLNLLPFRLLYASTH